MPSNIHIPVHTCLLIPAQTCTFIGRFALPKEKNIVLANH